MRRKLEDQLLRVRERFDRRLEEWVTEEDLREEWRGYLHNRVRPSGRPGIEPLIFQSRTEAGSVLEIRGLQERIAGPMSTSTSLSRGRRVLARVQSLS